MMRKLMKAVKQKASAIRRRVAWLISRWDMIVWCRLFGLDFDFYAWIVVV